MKILVTFAILFFAIPAYGHDALDCRRAAMLEALKLKAQYGEEYLPLIEEEPLKGVPPGWTEIEDIPRKPELPRACRSDTGSPSTQKEKVK